MGHDYKEDIKVFFAKIEMYCYYKELYPFDHFKFNQYFKS